MQSFRVTLSDEILPHHLPAASIASPSVSRHFFPQFDNLLPAFVISFVFKTIYFVKSPSPFF